MRKSIARIALAVLALPWALAAQEGAGALAMDAVAADGKDVLRINLSHLEKLGASLTAGMEVADINLLDAQGRVLATLGELKKGRIKWGHKTVQDRFLAVRFPAAVVAALEAKIRSCDPKPGFQLAACEAKTGAVAKAVAVVLCDLPDLAVQINYPVNAAPGQTLGKEVTATLENVGGVAARDIRLEVVLSSDDQVPRRPARESATYAEDILLPDGSATVPALEPGQQLTVSFGGGLKLPDDVPPSKHYLAVVADPADAIGELNEANNVNAGFIMIAPADPAAFTVEMPETTLLFEPANYGFKITVGDTLLSDGKDWKLCRMKPSVYQIKHVSWKDFFWEIDTVDRRAYKITGAEFCKKGGTDHRLDIKVEVSGGSLEVPPSRFILRLAQTRLRYEPQAKKFALLAYGENICHLPFWWVCRRESYLYQVRFALWENYFWQVDTFTREASKITDGKFCSAEGIAAKMPLRVTVEEK
jgi:hypothetical protein